MSSQSLSKKAIASFPLQFQLPGVMKSPIQPMHHVWGQLLNHAVFHPLTLSSLWSLTTQCIFQCSGEHESIETEQFRWGISNKMFIQLRSCNWNQILFWGPSSKGWVHASVTSRMTWHFAVTGNLNLNLHFLLLMGWGVRCNARVFVYYIKLAVLWYSLMNILEIFLSSPMAKLLQVFRFSSQWIQTTCSWSLDDPPFLHWIPDLIYTLRV